MWKLWYGIMLLTQERPDYWGEEYLDLKSTTFFLTATRVGMAVLNTIMLCCPPPHPQTTNQETRFPNCFVDRKKRSPHGTCQLEISQDRVDSGWFAVWQNSYDEFKYNGSWRITNWFSDDLQWIISKLMHCVVVLASVNDTHSHASLIAQLAGNVHHG